MNQKSNEIDLINKKLARIDSEIKEGKRKLLNEKEALGKCFYF